MRKVSAKLFASFLLVILTASASLAASAVKVETVPLERNGYKLHLERFSTASSDHKPLLMVHGMTYSSPVFNVDYKDYSLAKYFARRNYDVWLLDITGYGRSQEGADGFLPDSDYAAEDIAAAAKVILERSGAKQLDVLGWSWGTVTSGRFAAKYPDMVRKLVLYAPIVAGLADVKVTEPFNHNTWAHAAGDFQTNPDGSINYAIAEPEVVSTFQSNCWRYDKDSSPNGGRRDLLVSPEKTLIPTEKLTMPVLMIAGEKDQYVTPEQCREAFGTLANRKSRLEVVQGAAHLMMIEKPYYKNFRTKVFSFLRAK